VAARVGLELLLAREGVQVPQALVEQLERGLARARAAVESLIPTCKAGICAAFTVHRRAVACSKFAAGERGAAPSGAAFQFPAPVVPR
jgi:hypothetical protein